MTCGFILEEGADTEVLKRIAASMAETAAEAGVCIVAGDTKVVEGNGGIYINTSGVGFVPQGRDIGAAHCQPGDAILVSGTLGDHHAAILSSRMGIENQIQSDCAPLAEMVKNMEQEGVRIHAMRDITRGGLATIANEWAERCGLGICLEEKTIPVSPLVQSFCQILGLDPLYMGNEGKMAVAVDKNDEERALRCIQKSRYGQRAAVIGHIAENGQKTVTIRTALGGERVVSKLYGEGLPRIC